MKVYLIALLTLPLLLSSCSYKYYTRLIQREVSVNEAMTAKDEMDLSTNPARRAMIQKDLQKKLIRVRGVTVKRVIPSINLDYDYCMVVEATYDKGSIECYVYPMDFSDLAELTPGVSVVDFVGDFGKFFNIVEDSFTKIEVLNANISVRKK